jgi:hypothetical protein
MIHDGGETRIWSGCCRSSPVNHDSRLVKKIEAVECMMNNVSVDELAACVLASLVRAIATSMIQITCQ